MKARTFDRWIKALESGDFPKGRYRLYHRGTNTFCCLGVLESICRADFLHDDGYAKCDSLGDPLPHRGMSVGIQKKLSGINDRSDSFKPVIAYLKKNRRHVVEESK